MQKHTYVAESLKNGRIMRWTFMPLNVYIAPMNFYSKQGQDMKYRHMVIRALEEWQKATRGKISFKVVNTLLESNVNIDWKRVERKALGHCYFSFDGANRLYGAEVAIGLTEGLVHADYMDESEVYHTILHEIGHAIGLGHSHNKADIMYTPHQRGVNSISQGDVLTVNWLYSLPQGATTAEVASRYGIGGSDIDEIITKFINKKTPSEFEKVKSSVKIPKRDLLEEQETLANLRKYHMALQNVQISDEMKKFFINKKK
ncbi:TPA: hypothetical protein CPT81_07365 [Candidatus Gastranaerophilales bacterium HUM_20]|jgi:matrixin|nr:MAG: hypothetical protein BHW55_08285 [Candidatus Melainabacteria bacterium 35_41]CDE89404.1 gll3042 protein [Clostridium sp. CAG:729]DAB20128.1 MAG TPA: hypothetical protein CPT81_07365 [Candidatus Gastranaerophilales bacterium HUM_20]